MWQHRKVSTASSVSHQQALQQAVVTTITLACALIFRMSEPVCENAVWDKNETDKMMKYIQDHVALAGDGGNFKDSTYQAAATYIASTIKVVRSRQPSTSRESIKV